MKLMALVLTLAMTSPLAAAQDLGKDDVIKLKKAGVDDGTILKMVREANKKFELSSDDVVDLIAAGVAEEVVNAMLEGPAAKPESEPKGLSRPEPSTSIAFDNKTRCPLWVHVDLERKVVLFSSREGKRSEKIPSGTSYGLQAPPGTYVLSWNGRPTNVRFDAEEERSVALSFSEEYDPCCCETVIVVKLIRTAGRQIPPGSAKQRPEQEPEPRKSEEGRPHDHKH